MTLIFLRSFVFPLRFLDITDVWHCISWRYALWGFGSDRFIYLSDCYSGVGSYLCHLTSWRFVYGCVVGTFKIYSWSNFQVCNMVLTLVTQLHIRPQSSPVFWLEVCTSRPASSHLPVIIRFCFCEFGSRDSTYK